MREEGEVVSVLDGTALIRLRPHDPQGCAGCRICTRGPNDERTVSVPNPHGIAPGDHVVVEIPRPSRYLGSLLFFVLPLVFIGAFGAAGWYLGRALFGDGNAADLSIVVMGIVGMAASFLAVRLIDRLTISKKTRAMIVSFPGVSPNPENASE